MLFSKRSDYFTLGRSVLRLVLYLLIVAAVDGCNFRANPPPGPKGYLSKAYFNEQERCEKQAPHSESEFVKTDVGPSLHIMGRSSEWKTQAVYLGDTCYLAHVGPVYYFDQKRPSYYSIDVEARIRDTGQNNLAATSWLVLFGRDIRLEDLPADVEALPIRDIVSFNDSRRAIKFQIGHQSYEYVLPAP